MLTKEEQQLFAQVVAESNMEEKDILMGLSDLQRGVWVHHAMYSCTEEELMERFFSRRKEPSLRNVRQTLANAQLKIVANLLDGCDIQALCEERPALRDNLERLIERVQYLRSK
jgi:hypothetical protein